MKGLIELLFGAIEAGGTKIICGFGDENGNIHDSISFPTRDPNETIPKIHAYFENNQLDGLGIASFGPLEVNTTSAQYGTITSTPKQAWQNFNWLQALKEKMNCPIFIDTDVNAAALGETRFGAAKGFSNCIYITVGTGIGAGLVVEGNIVHGMMHPEVGHMMVRRHPEDVYKGHCSYHLDCLEGLASGPAIAERWGQKAEKIEQNHIAWEFEAYYLAQAIVNLLLVTSTQKIILGGGVMHQTNLIMHIRNKVIELLGNYINRSEITQFSDQYIVLPGLADFSGLKGALALAIYPS